MTCQVLMTIYVRLSLHLKEIQQNHKGTTTSSRQSGTTKNREKGGSGGGVGRKGSRLKANFVCGRIIYKKGDA